MYIYELENWPQLFWEQKTVDDLLTQLRYHQGTLIGGMRSIGFQVLEETHLETLTQDVVKTSEIEGEILDQSLVRSSIARHLGMEVAGLDRIDRNVDGIVEMMLDATQKFDQPLTKERLFSWHALLFPSGRSGFSKISVGAWRKGPVDVVSGYMGKETIHYEAPSYDKVNDEMVIFLNWLNGEDQMDLVMKAALAHFWFVTIHPFEDGNGRIARAIGDFLLARSENSPHRFYSLSAQIQKDRKYYYAILEGTQKGNLDITSWIKWFFNCLNRAIQDAIAKFNVILYKAHFWESIAQISLNERQRKIIHLIIGDFEGHLTTSKWAKLAKCSQDTAYRDILELMELGLLVKNQEGGRSTNYSLVHDPLSSN